LSTFQRLCYRYGILWISAVTVGLCAVGYCLVAAIKSTLHPLMSNKESP
jgi:hypothetical protein